MLENKDWRSNTFSIFMLRMNKLSQTKLFLSLYYLPSQKELKTYSSPPHFESMSFKLTLTLLFCSVAYRFWWNVLRSFIFTPTLVYFFSYFGQFDTRNPVIFLVEKNKNILQNTCITDLLLIFVYFYCVCMCMCVWVLGCVYICCFNALFVNLYKLSAYKAGFIFQSHVFRESCYLSNFL